MPDFPPEATAFTCRLRRGDHGRFRVMFAPAGGFGWSKPCCDDGHEDENGASHHGGQVLSRLLSRHLATTQS